MARRKKRSFRGSPEQHRTSAGSISKSMKRDAGYARDALRRAEKAVGAKKQDLCAGALDYMMATSTAKGAAYRERAWSSGRSPRQGNSANRVTESLKHKFRQVCLRHPRTSKRGHW